ncbi:MAG: hypothetical protein HY855_19860 [Burkholderiales bacterium]|nr:hypothetical protein [Burkholderiales bacterium]
MNAIVPWLAAMLISLSLSMAVLAVLSRPLARVLASLCPDESGVAFWLSYTRIMLTIAPLLATLLVDWGAAAGRPPLEAVRLTLMAALVGLLLGLYLVGRRLGGFVRVPPPPSGPAPAVGRP